MSMYLGRFRVLGPSFHWTHDHFVAFDNTNDTRATGFVSSHVEGVRNGEVLLGALRYADSYRRVGGAWKFEKRVLSFFYYVPANEYAEALAGPLRQRAYGDRRPADYPESLPTWVEGLHG